MYMKKRLLLTITALMVLFLNGCLMKSISDLYSLPKQPAEFEALQKAVTELLAGGAQYSAPIHGTNQQPVQMSDLDGDGEDEAVVFTLTSGKTPLKVYILDRQDDRYVTVGEIEGAGSSFDSVTYVQLDGQGGNEIILGRQVNDQTLRSLSVHRLENGQTETVFNANYSNYLLSDLDDDGNEDIFLLRFSVAGQAGTAELIRYSNGGLTGEGELPVSVTGSGLHGLESGMLSANHSAVFVSGVLDDGSTVSDAYLLLEDTFRRISSKEYLGLSTPAVKGYNIFATDIDQDGNVEFPQVVQLLTADTIKQNDACSVISWYNFDPENGISLKENTYYSFDEGWFLRLPTRLGLNFSVFDNVDASGISGHYFSSLTGSPSGGAELFSVHVLTGNNRDALAQNDDYFVLKTKGDTV